MYFVSCGVFFLVWQADISFLNLIQEPVFSFIGFSWFFSFAYFRGFCSSLFLLPTYFRIDKIISSQLLWTKLRFVDFKASFLILALKDISFSLNIELLEPTYF